MVVVAFSAVEVVVDDRPDHERQKTSYTGFMSRLKTCTRAKLRSSHSHETPFAPSVTVKEERKALFGHATRVAVAVSRSHYDRWAL